KLAGGPQRRQPMHASLDEIIAEPAENVGTDLPRRIDRRDQIAKDAVKISHERKMPQAGKSLLPWLSGMPVQGNVGYLRSLIQASIAGSARVLRSAEIAIVSWARPAITRPPEVA